MLSLIALGFTACDDTSDLGKMQINEQLPAVASDCVKIALGSAYDNSAWDLSKMSPEDKLTLVSTTAVKDLPTGATVTYGAEFSATEDFSDCVKTEIPENGSLTVTELDNIFRELFGMGPKPHTVYCRYGAYVNDGSQKLWVGIGNAIWQQSKSVEVTPIPKPMEEHYYFLSGATNWDLGKDNAVEMSYMSGVNIYDYPYFWIVITTTDEDTYWKIAPQSAQDASDWNAVMGADANGTAANEGTLIAGTPEKQAGAYVLKGKGRWIVRMNAMERTFTVVPASEALWTPGSGLNNWQPATSFPLPSNNGYEYNGYSYLGTDGFKLTTQPNWDGPGDYGEGVSSGWIAWKGDNGNIVPSISDFVAVSVNTGSWQISYAKITGFGLIGAFNDWKVDAVVAMSHDAAWQVWTADVTVPEDKYLFKFINSNENNEWDWNHNLGNYKDADGKIHDQNLVNNGENLEFPGAGTYTVTLDLTTVPYSYKIVKK